MIISCNTIVDRRDHVQYLYEIGLEKKCISSEPHYLTLSAFCTAFYGNRNSLMT